MILFIPRPTSPPIVNDLKNMLATKCHNIKLLLLRRQCWICMCNEETSVKATTKSLVKVGINRVAVTLCPKIHSGDLSLSLSLSLLIS